MGGSSGFLASTIGRKVIMAVTGLMLFGFVFVHMLGNLQLYQGPEAINAYAAFLKEFLHGAGIWIARGGLLTAALLHIWGRDVLTLANRAARPVGYRKWTAKESTYASRTMRWSGVIILLFLIYHLLHFTTGQVHPQFDEGDVYRNVVIGFGSRPASAFYIAAMLLLGMHLYHGVWSLFQTLGLSHPRWKRLVRGAAAVFAAVIVIGNVSFPLSVLFGFVR